MQSLASVCLPLRLPRLTKNINIATASGASDCDHQGRTESENGTTAKEIDMRRFRLAVAIFICVFCLRYAKYARNKISET